LHLGIYLLSARRGWFAHLLHGATKSTTNTKSVRHNIFVIFVIFVTFVVFVIRQSIDAVY